MGASWGQPGGPRRAGGGERASGRRRSGRDGGRARRACVVSTIERLCARHHGPGTRARAAQPNGAGTQDVGWIVDNTTISHAGAHGARFGGACGICRAHSPAKGTGVATADDRAAACMLLSQTRATTGGRRSLQWVHPQVVSRVSGEGFFWFFWRSRRRVFPAANHRPRIFAVRSGMIFLPVRSIRK